MKNTKKFLLGVFAMSALMLGACSGSNKPAPSSSVEPTPAASSSQATSSEPEASTSVEPESSSVDPESSSSETEPSSSAEVVTEQTVTINEAPAAGLKVVVWGWEGAPSWTNHEAVATVSGTSLTFDFGDVDIVGALVVELNEGYTTLKDDQGEWNNDAVSRKSNDFVPGTDTTVDWKVITTEEVDFSIDDSASALSSRTIFVQSWDASGSNTGYVANGKVEILKNATGFLVAVLNDGETEPNATWSNLQKTKDYTDVPETSITLYLSGSTLLAGIDGDDPTTAEVTYHLVGKIGGVEKWTFANGVALIANTASEGEYMLEEAITLSAGDELKVTDSNGGWYPATGGNWAITAAGDYQVYFRPAGHTADGWNGYFTVVSAA